LSPIQNRDHDAMVGQALRLAGAKMATGAVALQK